MSWTGGNCRRVDDSQDLTIAKVDDIAGEEVNAVFMETIGWIKGEVSDFPVPTRSRGEALTSGLLGLEHQIQWIGVVLEVELVRQCLKIDLLGVVKVL